MKMIKNKEKFINGIAMAIIGFALPNDPPYLFWIGFILCFAAGWTIMSSFNE